MLIRRLAFWETMRVDVFGWVELCWVCCRFRLRTMKVPAKFFVSRASAPWQHVLVDFEGPMTPADVDGYRYIFTYTCMVCLGSYLVAVKNLTHQEVRRAMITCVLRSLTIPWYLGHDGGPEFTSLLFQELESLLDIHTRVGTRWRPTEQAPVGREHQET